MSQIDPETRAELEKLGYIGQALISGTLAEEAGVPQSLHDRLKHLGVSPNQLAELGYAIINGAGIPLDDSSPPNVKRALHIAVGRALSTGALAQALFDADHQVVIPDAL